MEWSRGGLMRTSAAETPSRAS